MTSYENTFIRGPSPSYSEDVISENGMSTLPIGDRSEIMLNNSFICDKPKSSSMYQNLNRPEMKRRNTFAFWTLVTLLFILTVGNLLLTITIIGVLRLSKGMQSIELIPEEEIIKFFGNTDLDRIYKRDGNIEGFMDEPITIMGDGAGIIVNLLHRSGHSHNKMNMDENGINFKGINIFEIKNPITGEVIFTTHRPFYNIPNGVNNLNAKVISTSRITSPLDTPLKIEANKTVIRGSEGLNLEGEEIFISSDDKIILNTTMGSIHLIGNDGVFLDMDKIPVINSEHGIRSATIQYKICVCMPQGKLFRMPVPRGHNSKITCAHFNPKHDPCA